jgi:hypothetical protein
MATTSLHDQDSIPSSDTLKEEEKSTQEEGQTANAGDLEMARSKSEEKMDEKIDSEAEPEDPYLVTWKGSDDPENPLNFKSRRKVLVIGMVAAIAFLTYIFFSCCRH